MNVILRILFVLLFLSSCTDKRTKDYERIMKPIVEIKTNDQEVRVYDGVTEPMFPDIEENNKTVMGIDTNKDGVRDDIEIYLNRTYDNTNIRRALKQYVVGEYEFLSLRDDVESLIAKNTLEKSSSVLHCLSFVSPNYNSEMVKALSSLTMNTELRDEQFGRIYLRIGLGRLVGSDDGKYGYENWDKYCDFQIEDYEKTRSEFLKVYDVYMGKKREEK